jgi:hypothetical protein
VNPSMEAARKTSCFSRSGKCPSAPDSVYGLLPSD